MKKCFRVLRSLLLLVMVVCVCSGLAVVGKGYEAYQEAVDEISLEDKVAAIRGKDSFTEYEELPQIYVQAVMAVEDKRFLRHMGVDPIAICRAVRNDILAGSFVEGGSTITQQLAKNLYFGQDKDLTRKVAEVLVAMDLERNYSKEEIFELYVNAIYFGDGYYDVASASQGYFGKEPEDMNDSWPASQTLRLSTRPPGTRSWRPKGSLKWWSAWRCAGIFPLRRPRLWRRR